MNTQAQRNMGMKRTVRLLLVLLTLTFLAVALPASAQDVIKTGTGLGVEKVKLAVPEFATRNPEAGPREKVFHQVLTDDLTYSGIIEMVSPSFFPAEMPSAPGELKAESWSQRSEEHTSELQ